MDTQLVITEQTIRALMEAGGSGQGCSWHTTGSFCPRKVALQKTHSQVMRQHQDMLKLDVGTVFHFFADLYHGGGYSYNEIQAALPYSDLEEYGDVMREASRIFAEYTKRYTPLFWGDVLGTEWALHEESPEATKAIDEALVPGFTLRVDLVTRVTEEHRERIYELAGLDLLPGIYLADYKTKGSRPRKGAEDADRRLQFGAYQMAWNAAAPHLGYPPCQGMLVLNIVRLKKMDDSCFPVYLVPPPDETRQQSIKSALEHNKVIIESELPLGVINGCESYHTVCEFHPQRSGLCSLI